MNDLVFLEPNKIDAVPFTTSKVIAEITGISHRKIKDSIAKNKISLESFGLLVSYQAESTGGRPEEFVKLNEQQATLLITFLKNTPEVVKFKTELVRQFYAMRTELNRRHVERAQLKPIRREMTDVIQQVTDNKWAYKQYTDLAYKVTVGCIASQLRKQRKAEKKAAAIDFMTAEEIRAVSEAQYRIAVLLEMGLEYHEIKTMLQNRLMLKISA